MKLITMKNGFTMVEVAVVISVIGILAAIAIPLWQETMRNIRLKSEAQLLLANLQWAKGEAARRNSCIGIAFNTVAFPATGGNYTVFIDNNCNSTYDGSEQPAVNPLNPLRNVTITQDVSLINAAIGAGNSLCYTSNAVSCGSQQGNVQLRNGTRWYQLIISASGGLRTLRSSDGITWN